MEECESSMQFHHLCRLIDDSLHSFAEPQPCSPLTTEKERDLLIRLSQISKAIRALENDSEDEDHSDSDHIRSRHAPHSQSCFADILSRLVVFLNVESQYVRHSTSNVLAGISKYVSRTRGEWDRYLHLLCVCLEVSISNSLSPTSTSLITGTTEADSHSPRFVLHIQEKMVNANWYTVAGLVRVLRTITKYLKECPDGELREIYMNSVNSCLANIPWDLMNGMRVSQDGESQTSSNKDLSGKNGYRVSRFVFLGALLQLFCSVVHQSSSEDDCTSNEQSLIGKITSLVPKLLNWCFDKHGDDSWTSTSQYLKHKMLMLMIRLSFQVNQESSTLVVWLQLLHKYFQDLLCQSISKSYADLDDCLEGSPFLSSVANGQKVYRPHTRHLQRRAIFLFLKCCFGLIILGKAPDTRCSCAASVPCLTYELQSDQGCCPLSKGLLELSEWLNRHVPLDMFVDYELYLEKCGSFTSSFLQLYIDEDDILFQILLHLATLQFPVQQTGYREKDKAFKEMKGDVMIHLSNIFNPVNLFHLFLAELHYDHSLLLDYLVSKDAGIHCLQYLLRSLRAISNSWNLFMQFSVSGGATALSSYKKRRYSLCGSDSGGEAELVSPTGKEGDHIGILDNRSNENSNIDDKPTDTRTGTFQNAKSCLFSLKCSVENLHQNNLFPYNPSALLRSLTRFQELCRQQESAYPQKTGEMTR